MIQSFNCQNVHWSVSRLQLKQGRRKRVVHLKFLLLCHRLDHARSIFEVKTGGTLENFFGFLCAKNQNHLKLNFVIVINQTLYVNIFAFHSKLSPLIAVHINAVFPSWSIAFKFAPSVSSLRNLFSFPVFVYDESRIQMGLQPVFCVWLYFLEMIYQLWWLHEAPSMIHFYQNEMNCKYFHRCFRQNKNCTLFHSFCFTLNIIKLIWNILDQFFNANFLSSPWLRVQVNTIEKYT